MSEYFEQRYDSRFLKLLGAACVFVFFIPYTAAVFMGLSYLFESSFQVPYWVALVGMGAFTALYLVLGGYKAMTMIDVVFGMIMTVGVVVLAAATLTSGGGLGAITTNLAAQDPRLTQLVGPPGWWPLFCLVFLTSVAPFGMPQLVQKFYAIKDDRSIRIGMWAQHGLRPADRGRRLLRGRDHPGAAVTGQRSGRLHRRGPPGVRRPHARAPGQGDPRVAPW